MRRQVIRGAAVALAAIVVVGIVVIASQEGWFGGKRVKNYRRCHSAASL